MKKFIIITLSLISICSYHAEAQKKKKSINKQAITSKEVSVKEEISRDSAFANPQLALKKLMLGNENFVGGKAIKPRQNEKTLEKTSAGQYPFAVIVGCSDSRVPNEIIFDQGIGDLFVLRSAGQVMSDPSYASIEFAVLELKSKLIVVLGHEKCGAVKATINKVEVPGSHISALTKSIAPAVEKSKSLSGDNVANAIKENVIEQVNELRNLQPIISKKYKDGEILIVGAVYNLHTGKVEFLEETFK